jgi:hypothetical protein
MAAPDIARVTFEEALGRICLNVAERGAFVNESGCTNIAMMVILPHDQVRQICKCLRSREVNLIPLPFKSSCCKGCDSGLWDCSVCNKLLTQPSLLLR